MKDQRDFNDALKTESSLVRGKWIERYKLVPPFIKLLSSLVRGKWIERRL